jgi:hypothetical protein
MIAGAVGLIIALTFLFMRRRGSRPPTEVYEERRYNEPSRPYDDPYRRYSEPPARPDDPTRPYGESDVYQERRYSDPPV